MELDFDLVIRGGTVVDGTGTAPFEADVGIRDGRVVVVGKVSGHAAEELALQDVVKWLSHDTAHAVGLNDRGVIRPGYKADINVFDLARLQLHAPEVAYDLPSGGRRLVQRADGYSATIVSGTVVQRNGEPTGALPGRLVRGAQGEPVV